MQKGDIFLTFAKNIDCGYMLEPPQCCGSNEYPLSMFKSKNKKHVYPTTQETHHVELNNSQFTSNTQNHLK